MLDDWEMRHKTAALDVLLHILINVVNFFSLRVTKKYLWQNTLCSCKLRFSFTTSEIFTTSVGVNSDIISNHHINQTEFFFVISISY